MSVQLPFPFIEYRLQPFNDEFVCNYNRGDIMYAAFNLKIEPSNMLFNSYIKRYNDIGLKREKRIKSEIENDLKRYINNGIIDGSVLSDDCFKIIKSDVFISYSHDDEDIAISVAGYLHQELGLDVFVDSLVWDSADALLKDIDDTYCKQDSENYNYQKRNLSTSHVHAMLSTAIIKAMDTSEIVIFLNTDNSIPKIDNVFSRNYTKSPWIYEEIMFATLLRRRHWSNHRNVSIYESAGQNLQVKYNVPISNMKEITFEMLRDWKKEYDKWLRCKGRYGDLLSSGDTHPLNCLYKMVFGESK